MSIEMTTTTDHTEIRNSADDDVPSDLTPWQRLMANVVTLDAPYGTPEIMRMTDGPDANVITSRRSDGLHAPVLDIDFGARLIPSSTLGHFHLYLDKAMTWSAYRRLLIALGDAEILEPGYVEASLRRGHSAARLPGVRKPEIQS